MELGMFILLPPHSIVPSKYCYGGSFRAAQVFSEAEGES